MCDLVSPRSGLELLISGEIPLRFSKDFSLLVPPDYALDCSYCDTASHGRPYSAAAAAQLSEAKERIYPWVPSR